MTDGAFFTASNLSVRFGGIAAVNEVSFSVGQGQIFGILGPNGAGKTTTFNLIAGAIPLDSGKINLDGIAVNGLRPDQRARTGIARTFQITQPFDHLSVEENVMVGCLLRGGPIASMRDEARTLLEAVGLGSKMRDEARRLSTGQRKRLELARALATRPRLLLLDEVTGGVDQPSIPGLIDLVAKLRDRGITIIIIEHNMRVMTGLADRLMFLNRGTKLTEGPPAEVMRHPEVLNLYLGSAHA
ncbi:ABC transporter ATP-binding protein [Mesorhizobium sp. 2RAF21]|uniref:ABC transporter ATP-binding protein n=1 Tax=Mesorhizobium sp. 2RAF21 TaxID=3232995 RepID=UPI003F9A6B99